MPPGALYKGILLLGSIREDVFLLGKAFSAGEHGDVSIFIE
jgi:hypothetical protein